MKKLLLLLLVCSGLHAEPIEFIVSASAGGPNDTTTRKVVELLEKKTNLEFVIMNKPGAAHTIAYGHVLNTTKPTLIMSTSEIEAHEVYNHIDELYTAGHFINTLYVSEKSGMKSLNDLIRLSKEREINFGHGGIGSYSYLSMNSLCKKTLRCLDVPYKSGAEGMMAVLTGTIDAFALASYGTRQYLENDKYVAIHTIRLSKEKSWFKLFGKNLSEKDKQLIISTLKHTDNKFFNDMGFEK